MVNRLSTVSLTEFQKKIQKLTDKKVKKIRKKANHLIKSVTKILESLEEEAEDMIKRSKEELKEGVETLAKKKAGYLDAVRSLEKFGETITNTVPNIKIPTEINHKTLIEFHKNVIENFTTLVKTKNKLDHKIHPYFILLRSRVKGLIKKLEEASYSLKKFIESEYSEVELIEQLYNELDNMRKLLNQLNNLKEQFTNLERKIDLKQKEIIQMEQKLTEMEKQEIFQSLVQIKEEIRITKTKIMNILNSFRKPFKKFLNLVTSGEAILKLDEKDALVKYINNPFNMFINEDKDASKLKILLLKMDVLIREEKIELEKRLIKRLQKALESIIKQNTLTKLSEKYFKLLEEREKILQKREIQELINERKLIEEKNKELTKLKDSLRRLQESIIQIQEKIEGMKIKIEGMGQQITGISLKLSVRC